MKTSYKGWIRVGDSLPHVEEDGGLSDCVLATDGRSVQVCYLQAPYDDDDVWPSCWKVFGRDFYDFDDVTHWQPLPEMPTEE